MTQPPSHARGASHHHRDHNDALLVENTILENGYEGVMLRSLTGRTSRAAREYARAICSRSSASLTLRPK
jgi:hypothetical protein